jgi:hypothetical protein
LRELSTYPKKRKEKPILSSKERERKEDTQEK